MPAISPLPSRGRGQSSYIYLNFRWNEMPAVSLSLIVQMWLLTAALERFLAGYLEGILPAAIVSAVLLLACFGLYRFIRGRDRETRGQ